MIEKSKKPTLIQRFFLFAGGTDREILQNCSNRTWMIYTGLGVTVLIPAVMGFCASYYFLLSTLKTSGYVTFIGSLTWALIIFTFDRFIVMAFRRSSYSSKGRFWLAVFGRLILATVVAYTIAYPLVLRMFQPNIEQFLYSKSSLQKNAIVARYAPLIARKEKQINALEMVDAKNASHLYQLGTPGAQKIKNLRNAISKEYSALADEIAGKSKRTGERGDGPVAHVIKAKINYLEAQLKEAIERADNEDARKSRTIEVEQKVSEQLMKQNALAIQDKKAEIAQIEEAEKTELKNFEATRAHDFLTQSNALEELAKKNWNVRKWDYLITIIFIVVDIMPLFLKMSLGKEEYDWKLETDQLAVESDELIRREVLTLTKEARQKTAALKSHYASTEEQLRDLTDHHATILDIFGSHLDSKMKQYASFMDKLMRHKQGLGNDGDHKHAFENEMAEVLRSFFRNAAGMSEDFSRFFGGRFNDRHNDGHNGHGPDEAGRQDQNGNYA